MTPGAYDIREDGTSVDDKEIRRSSQAATRRRKLSSRVNGNWGLPPVRVERRRAQTEQPLGLFFFCVLLLI